MVRFDRRHAFVVLAGLVAVALGSFGRMFTSKSALLRPTSLLGIVFPLVFTALVIGYTYRYARHRDSTTLLTSAAAGAVGLGAVFVVGALGIVWGQQAQGVRLVDPDLLVAETGLGGATVGLVVGHQYGRTLAQRRRIRAHEQRLQVLTRILRHNLRNELDVALGHIETATDDAPESLASDLSEAVDAINDLVATADLARSAQQTLGSTATFEQDLVDVTERAVVRAREDCSADGVRLTAGDGELPVTAVDGVADALHALFRDACKRGRGSIEVEVYRTDHQGVVEIADLGAGIPDQELAAIEAGEETKLEHGSGIGLWVTYWIVEQSGGDLTFETDGETTVRVALPLAKAKPERKAPSPSGG